MCFIQVLTKLYTVCFFSGGKNNGWSSRVRKEDEKAPFKKALLKISSVDSVLLNLHVACVCAFAIRLD
ncbi:hypothetical protein ATG66_2330 [Vibrio sp. ES.051]|nr:hypothetical protein ATG66_2330 [Vibrio sp. ES.051]